jgi:hypothetical protein
MEGGGMEPKEVFSLGLGLSAPWQVAGHRLDVVKRPNELHLEVVADRGALFPCPDCKRACKAHDFGSFTWRHLNFFQYECHLQVRVPRVRLPNGAVRQVDPDFAGRLNGFTLLFEALILMLAQQMPFRAVGRIVGALLSSEWVPYRL